MGARTDTTCTQITSLNEGTIISCATWCGCFHRTEKSRRLDEGCFEAGKIGGGKNVKRALK